MEYTSRLIASFVIFVCTVSILRTISRRQAPLSVAGSLTALPDKCHISMRLRRPATLPPPPRRVAAYAVNELGSANLPCATRRTSLRNADVFDLTGRRQ